MTLVCPHCSLDHEVGERFCRRCGMPLAYADGEQEPVTAEHERARKVRPQYARGELVKVAWARNLAEGELIQGILLDQGIPSILRRTRGFDVPDFLAAGPRDVLVPESGREAARALLSDAEVAGSETEPGSVPAIASPARLALWILAIAGIGFGLLLLATATGS